MLATNKVRTFDGVVTVLGLAFRAFRGESDFPTMVEIANRCNTADQVDEVETIENLAKTVKYFVKNARRDVVIVEVGDEMVGWGRVWFREQDDGQWIHILVGYVAPEWRRRGIGRALVHYQKELLREIARENQTPAPRFFQTFAPTVRVGKIALFQSEGYVPIRYFYEMLRPNLEDLPEVRLPEGLELRPAEPEHYRAIWEAHEEAFRDHWGSFHATEAHYQMFLNHENFDPTLWQVAWDGEQVAGSAINIFDRARADKFGQHFCIVDKLSVRRPWRKRGVARALLAASFKTFRARGMTGSIIDVDAENPNGAVRLYESVGYQIMQTGMALRKAME